MARTNNRILAIQWFIIFCMTCKTLYGLIVYDEYDFRILLTILIVNVIICVVFIFALCKIRSIAKKHMIDLKNCYTIAHFFCILVLIVHWSADSVLFYKAD